MIPGVEAQAIDISSNGSEDFVFTLRTNGLVARWNGSGFQNFGGYGVEISVDAQGDPWVANGLGELWEYTGTAWYHLRESTRAMSMPAPTARPT